MPHLSIQVTSEFNEHLNALGKALHLSLKGSPDLAMERLKTQLHLLPQVLVGEKGEPEPMICVHLAVLEGRSEEIRLKYARCLKRALDDFVHRYCSEGVLPKTLQGVKRSVEIREMNRASYLT